LSNYYLCITVGVKGSILNEKGEPFREAQVLVSSTTQELMEKVRVNLNSGQFFHMLPEGKFDFKVSAPGYKTLQQSVSVVQDQMASVSLVLKEGKNDEIIPAVSADLSYYYYPRKNLVRLKQKYPHDFDVYRYGKAF